MAERSLSALIVVDPANLYYLTGYNAWSFYTPQCVIVPADGPCHLFSRYMDAQGAQHTAYLPPEHIHGYPDYLVHRADMHPFDWIAGTALEIGLLPDTSDAHIALEMDAHFFSPRGFLAIQGQLTHASLVDSHELVNWVRVIKSEREQAKLRSAGQIAQRVMEIAIEQIIPGRRQCDVVAEIQHAQALGSQYLGGDYPAIVPMLPTGITSGTPHLTWSDLPLLTGEATTIEIAGVHQRYHAPLARTVALGTPPNRLRTVADAVSEGMAAALEQMRPGSTGRDVHWAFARTIGRYGLEKESRIGYSIGIGYPPDWGERTMSIRPEEETVIEAGMAFHIILGMWMDGWGYETSESLLVTSEGAEQLTNVPRGLTVKE
ncbi:M24 family metallopeptidase [Leekyejoonella antrihumi]|uniref:M24 family metallopeptidase n=2 Tax=Leekyejoonella antrihumi TaxID=1660198 RepID=A0A563DZR2_9MICO|nr:M24 family metallopeptidase [Leekyejoonella antrihumi]